MLGRTELRLVVVCVSLCTIDLGLTVFTRSSKDSRHRGILCKQGICYHGGIQTQIGYVVNMTIVHHVRLWHYQDFFCEQQTKNQEDKSYSRK